MNITFLIGNGFDLNLGLKTRYVDFLDEYIRPVVGDSIEVANFKEDLSNDRKGKNDWADAEFAMGQYSKRVASLYKHNAAEIYCDLHDDFCEKLAKYLESQERRIDLEKCNDKFQKSFLNILRGFTPERTTLLKSKIQNQQGGFYNLIIFNYTRIIDNFLKKGKRINIRTHHANTRISFEDSIKEVIHVHGTTSNSMVLGVNDITQIGEPKIFDGAPEEFRNTFIKEEFNKMAEESTHKKTKEILDKSHMIYIYGMSLGTTDKLWWQRIYDLLVSRPDLEIIIYCKDAPKDNLSRRKFLTFEREQKEKLLHYSVDIFTEKEIKIMERIHVTSYNIFEDLQGFANDDALEDSSVKNIVNKSYEDKAKHIG